MLALKYTFFALLSILVNLGVQYLSFSLYDGPGALYPALALGTLAGLVVKYILDKRWIFYHTPRSGRDDLRKFILYSGMGLLTTLIFWGTEILFAALFSSPAARYLGGGIGLTLGYLIKYRLDKRFVFIHQEVLTK